MTLAEALEKAERALDAIIDQKFVDFRRAALRDGVDPDSLDAWLALQWIEFLHWRDAKLAELREVLSTTWTLH